MRANISWTLLLFRWKATIRLRALVLLSSSSIQQSGLSPARLGLVDVCRARVAVDRRREEPRSDTAEAAPSTWSISLSVMVVALVRERRVVILSGLEAAEDLRLFLVCLNAGVSSSPDAFRLWRKEREPSSGSSAKIRSLKTECASGSAPLCAGSSSRATLGAVESCRLVGEVDESCSFCCCSCRHAGHRHWGASGERHGQYVWLGVVGVQMVDEGRTIIGAKRISVTSALAMCCRV